MAKPYGVSPRTNVKQEATVRLQETILGLRRDGVSFEEIARRLDLSAQYVGKLYRQAIASIKIEGAEEAKRLDLLRLDRAIMEAMRLITTNTPLIHGGVQVRVAVEDEDGRPMKDAANHNKTVTRALADESVRLQATAQLTKLMERRARLLGLDAPTKTALTDPTGTKAAPGGVMFYIPSNGRDTDDQAQQGAGSSSGD